MELIFLTAPEMRFSLPDRYNREKLSGEKLEKLFVNTWSSSFSSRNLFFSLSDSIPPLWLLDDNSFFRTSKSAFNFWFSLFSSSVWVSNNLLFNWRSLNKKMFHFNSLDPGCYFLWHYNRVRGSKCWVPQPLFDLTLRIFSIGFQAILFLFPIFWNRILLSLKNKVIHKVISYYPLISLNVLKDFDSFSFSKVHSFNLAVTDSCFCFHFFKSSHFADIFWAILSSS